MGSLLLNCFSKDNTYTVYKTVFPWIHTDIIKSTPGLLFKHRYVCKLTVCPDVNTGVYVDLSASQKQPEKGKKNNIAMRSIIKERRPIYVSIYSLKWNQSDNIKNWVLLVFQSMSSIVSTTIHKKKSIVKIWNIIHQEE